VTLWWVRRIIRRAEYISELIYSKERPKKAGRYEGSKWKHVVAGNDIKLTVVTRRPVGEVDCALRKSEKYVR
jgi:hypothetical protein